MPSRADILVHKLLYPLILIHGYTLFMSGDAKSNLSNKQKSKISKIGNAALELSDIIRKHINRVEM